MKKMLLIMGMVFLFLGFSNVYGQTAPFVPVTVNVHIASGTGNVIKPKLNFYKFPNVTTPAYIYTWYDAPYMVQGSSGSAYVAVPEAGTYYIAFQGENPLHTVIMSNVILQIEKGSYNLNIYVDPLNNNSRMTITGPR